MLGNVPKMGKPVDWTYSTAISEGTADCHCSAEDSNSCDRVGIIATAAPNATIFIVSFFFNKKTFLNACSLHYHTLGRHRKERRVRWYRCLERVKVWWLPLKRRKLVVSSALNYFERKLLQERPVTWGGTKIGFGSTPHLICPYCFMQLVIPLLISSPERTVAN